MTAANSGTATLTAWWKTLSKDQRNALDSDAIAELKNMAQAADAKEKTDENV